MAVNFAQAYYDFLVADAALTNLLSEYKGRPAIFTTGVAPAEAVLPYIVTPDAVSDVPAFIHKQATGRNHGRDVRCYVSKKQHRSVQLVDEIAERVWDLFEGGTMSVPGLETFDVGIDNGPIALDDEEAMGRILTTRLVVV